MARGRDKGEFYNGIHKETYYSCEDIQTLLTDDYVRGLIEGEGHFGADTRSNGEKIPSFMLKMHIRDKELIEGVRNYLKLKNRVYEYRHQDRHYAMLIIRDIPTLKNKIVPLFREKLLGFKGTQFAWWIRTFPYLNSIIYHKNEAPRANQWYP